MATLKTLTINGSTFNVVPVVPATSVTLSASAWKGGEDAYSQVVALAGVTANTKVDLQPTAEQLQEFHYKVLGFVSENVGGVVTVYSIGDKPTRDHTIQVTLTEVEGTGRIRGNTVGTTMPRANLGQEDPGKADYVIGREEFLDEAVRTALAQAKENGGQAVASVEPADDDMPKVFFGGALQQTKDEKVVPIRYISRTDDFSGYAEIKAQGNSSMNYPKKNQTVKLFKDAACEEKLKVDFKGWGKQNKHVYKANWIDLSHARNIVSARLWADVVKSRANYMQLPELLRKSPNQGAVDGFPVKVYADGVYHGRYTLNIPKDKWTFNMDDEMDNHCVLCGENYSSGCFRAAAKIDESDWTDEIHDTAPASIKTRWNEVISFVMNSTDEDFRANLNQYFYVDSLIDYYLFALASCGLDAMGKNQIYATYDGQRWIASMYDMDSTWGLYWNGSMFVATDYARTSYEDFANGRQGNLLYMRLEQLFCNELQERWAELKNGALSIENIINRFERFTDIASAELVREDYASTTGGGKFTGIPSKDTNNIQQIRAFALARQTWTSEYVATLIPAIPVPCEGITLNKNTMTFSGEGTQTVTATIIPDGCTDNVVWVSSNPSVATISVDGAVCTVVAIANGNTSITVTCGKYSASCAVAVSGIAQPVPCTGITLDKTELIFTKAESKTIVATVTPYDTTDRVVWSSDNESVATVVSGVVTAIKNGSCTITATCGNYSANCSVEISGIVAPPLFAFENGVKTFADGSVLEVTNGNHVKFTNATGKSAIINIARVTQNGDDIAQAISAREHTTIYTLPAKITRVVVKFADSNTTITSMCLLGCTPNNPNGTYNVTNNYPAGTDFESTKAYTYTDVSAIGIWAGAVNGGYVMEFDVEMYTDNERVF